MTYFYQFFIPVISVATILYLIFYFNYMRKHVRVKLKTDSDITSPEYYSKQEIYNSQKKYIQLYLSERVPDFAKFSIEKRNFFLLKQKVDGFDGIKYFTQIFNSDRFNHNCYLLLGSAGIGKTTFLINLFATCKEKSKNLNIILFPLRVADLRENIGKIATNKSETVLLLDGFDELTDANVISIKECIDLTKGFKHVVITSRIEYFSNLFTVNIDNQLLYSLGKDLVPNVNVLYIMPFSKEDVNHYLKKVFSEKRKLRNYFLPFMRDLEYHEAKTILNKVKFASLRPLFLFYITDLIKGEFDSYTYDFEIYEELINKWLLRETIIDQRNESAEDFKQILIQIALRILEKGNGYCDLEDILEISQTFGKKITDASNKAKSLLVCNKENKYYFFHSSISDYLLALNTFHKNKNNLPNDMILVKGRDLYENLLYEMIIKYYFNNNSNIVGYCGNTLSTNMIFPISDIRTRFETQKVKFFHLQNQIPFIGFIQLFPNLESLKYEYFDYINLQDIISLKNLKFLDISNNKYIRDLTFLNDLKSLQEINISNSIVDLRTIPVNSSLKKIKMGENHFSSEMMENLSPEILNLIE